VAEETAVRDAAGAGCEAFVGQRHGDLALAGAHRGLGQRPVDDIKLRMVAADLPQIDANRQRRLGVARIGPS
jgi:hypothetical protein